MALLTVITLAMGMNEKLIRIFFFSSDVVAIKLFFFVTDAQANKLGWLSLVSSLLTNIRKA
jgi:hypothetical protein